jgi:hypothetical protein
MRSDPVFDATTRPRALRTGTMLAASVLLHGLLGLMLYFDVAGIGGGFGLGVGPGFGIGSGGGVGLGEKKRREIFSLEDIPEVVRPQEQRNDEEIKDLVVARTPQAITVPQPVKPKAVTGTKTGPVVQFARPVKPVGAGTDLGARFAQAGKGTGGFGIGGGGGGLGISLGTAFGKYVGTLRKGGLDVAIVVDASGSMQNIIDDLKRRLGDMTANMQRLVPSARIGAVVYRDKADDKIATAPRQSEDFVVKWTDLTLNTKKVQSFLGGIVAEGGGDWKEAVKDGLQTAMTQLKWRPDAKKVIILIGSSPPHDEDVGAIRSMVSSWTGQNGVVSTVDVSQQLHEEHERKLNKWLYGDEPREMTPLPEFYAEVRASFGDMARAGGGTSVALAQPQGLMRHILVMAFGPQWEKDVSRVARGRS